MHTPKHARRLRSSSETTEEPRNKTTAFKENPHIITWIFLLILYIGNKASLSKYEINWFLKMHYCRVLLYKWLESAQRILTMTSLWSPSIQYQYLLLKWILKKIFIKPYLALYTLHNSLDRNAPLVCWACSNRFSFYVWKVLTKTRRQKLFHLQLSSPFFQVPNWWWWGVIFHNCKIFICYVRSIITSEKIEIDSPRR